MKNKINSEEILKSVEEQLKNIRAAINKVDEINPDTEMYLQGRDIYIMHVDHVIEEIETIIKKAKTGKQVYSTEWQKNWIKDVEEANQDYE